MNDDDVVFIRWTSATTAAVSGCARWSEANYAAGFLFKPHYPVPALRTDTLYWRMPARPLRDLIAQWFIWRQGDYPKGYLPK